MSEVVEKVSFRQSFWFLPSVYNVLAAVLAAITLTADYSLTKDMLAGLILVPVDLSIPLLAALVGAILTMTTITFSTIMVVLTTYSSQFSPRVLQNFISDRVTQHVLAIFSSGFTFSLLALLFMNKNNVSDVIVTPSVAVIWGLVGIGSFVYFINHVATWVQVNNLIGFLVNESEKTIIRVTERDVEDRRSELLEDDAKALARTEGKVVHSAVSGYVTYIDLQALIDLAREQQSVVQMNVHVGQYVMDGIRIMTVHGQGGIDEDKYQNLVYFGHEPKDWQDIAFTLRKLAEIGMRGVSPSINDPNTAATCINRMTPLLAMLAERERETSAFYDDDHRLRLIAKDFRFEDYLHKALQGIRHYGCSDVIVVSAILDTLALIARSSPAATHPVLWEFGANTVAGFTQSRVMASEQRQLLNHFKPLAELTGHLDEYEQEQALQAESARES